MAGIIRRPRLGGAVYILPNLLTTGNLFFGFFSIVKSLEGQFASAAPAILLAALFDLLDGRVARLTNATSEFGVQYDSICDVVSFGVAPAFLMYQFSLHDTGRIGWVICFLFMACGALRLARFNVQASIGKSSGDFTGLPIPMAAITVACFVALVTDLGVNRAHYEWVPALILDGMTSAKFRDIFLFGMGPLLAFAMVSNIVYRSHKKLRITAVKPFKLLVLIVVVTGLIAYEPEVLGFLIATSYALSGPLEWLLGWKKPTDDDEIFQPFDEGESVMEPANGDDAPDGGNGR